MTVTRSDAGDLIEKEDIAALLGELEAAFGDLPVPPDDQIVYDNSGDHLECNQIRAKLRGRHWRDLSSDDLAGEADSLGFLTPEAFRFFLPASITVSLIDPERADLIPNVILWSLAKPALSEFWSRRGESILEGAEAHGIPKGLLSELAAAATAGGHHGDEARERRLEMLSTEQKRAVRNFISFLRRHRSGEFPYGELDRVEEALTS